MYMYKWTYQSFFHMCSYRFSSFLTETQRVINQQAMIIYLVFY